MRFKQNLGNCYKHKNGVLVALMVIIQSFLLFNSTNVPRGSDQFWYIVDAESVSNGVFVTNNIFPNSLPSDNSNLRPFVQNRPIVYIAGSLIKLGFRSVIAYKIINLISYYIIVLILLFSLKALKVRKEFVHSTIMFFMASPLIIFSIYNPLTNVFDAMLFAFFVASSFIFFQMNLNILGKIILFVAIVIFQSVLIYERSDFLIYSCIVFLLLFIDSIRKGQYSLMSGFLVLLLLVGCNVLLRSFILFPQHLGGTVPSYSLIFTNVNGSIGNMVSFFGTNADFLTLSLRDIVVTKLFNFLKALMEVPNAIAFFYLLLGFLPILRNGLNVKKWKLIELIAVLIVIVNIVMLIAFQFQYRYIVFFVAPATLILYQNLFISEFNKYLVYINLICVALFVVFNLQIYRSQHAEGKRNLEMQKKLELLSIQKNSKVAVVYVGGDALIWSWLLKDIKEVHYILPNDMKILQKNNYDIKIYSLSDLKTNKKKLESDNFFIVENYYLKFD